MKTTTGKVSEAYTLLDSAKYSKMESKERIALIKAMRAMKKVAEDFNGFRQDAVKRLMPDNFEDIANRINEFNAMSQQERVAAVEKPEYADALRANAKFNADVESCIAEETAKEIELAFEPLAADAFVNLLDSNPEWTAGQAMLAEDMLCGSEESGKGKE